MFSLDVGRGAKGLGPLRNKVSKTSRLTFTTKQIVTVIGEK